MQEKILSKLTLQKKHGFTLIEVIVALGIFIIISSTLFNIYFIYTKAQRETGQRQKIISEMEFIMEKMAQEIRLNEIVYRGDFNYGAGSAKLYIKDGESCPSGDEVCIDGKEVELALANSVKYYFVTDDTSVNSTCRNGKGLYKYIGTSCQKLFTIPSVEISDAGFFIDPAIQPYPDTNSDCGSTANSKYNGYYCQCSSNGDCYSGTCETAPPTPRKCSRPDQQPRVTFFIKALDNLSNSTIFLQTTVSGRVYKR